MLLIVLKIKVVHLFTGHFMAPNAHMFLVIILYN